jgi:tryptophan-rich sensory protein
MQITLIMSSFLARALLASVSPTDTTFGVILCPYASWSALGYVVSTHPIQPTASLVTEKEWVVQSVGLA